MEEALNCFIELIILLKVAVEGIRNVPPRIEIPARCWQVEGLQVGKIGKRPSWQIVNLSTWDNSSLVGKLTSCASGQLVHMGISFFVHKILVETSSSSSGSVRRVMSNANFSVELFDGSGHFGMWQGEVLDALFQQDTSMNEHITTFNELVADLLSIDETFKDEDLALMLLSYLLDEFEHLETTLLHGKDNDILKDVTAALYNYELKKKTKKESTYEGAEVMVARGRSKNQKLKRRGRSKSKSRLGKDEYLIRLKNQDGSIKVLTDIRYVPSLKKNNISLGVLESKGSVVTMRNGVLKVTSGTLVMMKGIMKNDLYYYQGSIIIGAVATASGGDNLDTTQLWHMRLGHAGEKSLQILEKK
ncbi:hypothetical protein F3Y22_tig00111708pilonHSYRG00539 [Hibiscus syriacus]|uniref:GAG-pre-integrase domain-containing protein n=1 Tax=Hibiscus syriacus TaxID=106335 RepID=A0A6A2XHL7_HIBSY|nr:hypothetical protein F3Y22_tig00111708pilonHSYRG00539 [Hibiscus syriacus]